MSTTKQHVKYFKLFTKIFISGLALYFVFSKIDLAATWDLLKTTHIGYVLIGILIFICSQILSAYRLNIFFNVIKVNITNLTNIKLYALGMFYNLILPSGIGGDGYKLFFLKKKGHAGTQTLLQALLLDRVVGLFALLILLFILPLFLQKIVPYQQLTWLLIIPMIASFYLAFKILFKDFTSIFSITLIQSIGIQLLQLLTVWCLLKALGMTHISFEYYFLFLVSSIAAAIPFTLGGAGARELVFLFGANWFNLDINIAIALSLLFYLCTVIVSLTGLYFALNKEFDIW